MDNFAVWQGVLVCSCLFLTNIKIYSYGYFIGNEP